MRILAFAGTNSRRSMNRDLLEFVLSKFTEDQIEVVDLHDFEMPLYNLDREREEGIPQLALDFAKKVDAADLIIMSLAEHNGSYSVAFKNVYDWISRIPGREHWGGKNIFVMATSSGERGGVGVLEIAINRFPFSGGRVVASFNLPKFHENFDFENGIVNAEKAKELADKIQKIKENIPSKSSIK